MNVAGTRRGDLADSSLVRPSAQPRAELESPRARGPLHAERRVFSFDSAASRCASQTTSLLPARLQPPSLNSRTTALRVQQEVPGATHRSASGPGIASRRYLCRRQEGGFGRFDERAETCADHTPSVDASRAGFLRSREANFRLRQCCAHVRSSRSGTASGTLSASIAREPTHRIVRPAQNLRRPPTDRGRDAKLPIAVTSVAGGRRWDSPDWSIMRTDAQSCVDVESPRARVPACTFNANAMNQSALPAHPRAGSCVELGESRRRASPGDDIAHGRSTRNRVQYRVVRQICLTISGYAAN